MIATREAKKQYFLDELIRMNVTHGQCGTSIYDLSYEDLKSEAVLASFREIDIKADSDKWF